jgi:hypothetical protein
MNVFSKGFPICEELAATQRSQAATGLAEWFLSQSLRKIRSRCFLPAEYLSARRVQFPR